MTGTSLQFAVIFCVFVQVQTTICNATFYHLVGDLLDLKPTSKVDLRILPNWITTPVQKNISFSLHERS